MEKNDKKFMRLALKKAYQGVAQGQTPFGACIVQNNKVVALEHNRVWKTTDSTAHAEIVAIRQACKKLRTIDLSDCVIYSTCEPCPMCFSACHWARIKRIVFGATISDAKKFGFNELRVSNQQLKKQGKLHVRIHKKVLAREAQKLFRFWDKRKTKQSY